jgi:hypothetical protein
MILASLVGIKDVYLQKLIFHSKNPHERNHSK